MKRIISLLLCFSMLCGCTTSTKNKNTETEVEKVMETLGDLEYEMIYVNSYNTDLPGENLVCSIELQLDTYCLVKLVNKSDVCYTEVDYEVNGFKGLFTNVAGNATIYSLVEVDDASQYEEVTITDYTVSDSWILNAKSYVSIEHHYNPELKRVGYFDYTLTDHRIYTSYIILYNHIYVGRTNSLYGYLPDVLDLNNTDYGDEDYTGLYANVDGLGSPDLLNHEHNYQLKDFGKFELFPEYVVMKEIEE